MAAGIHEDRTVPIFSNRTLASMLRGLPPHVRTRCEADLLGRLTSDGHIALAAEWELFSLSQMARGGTLDLAPPAQPGVPDAVFTSAGHSPIVVEVTALNDRDLEERFADDALGMLFYRAINRLTGRPVGALDVHAVWPVGDRSRSCGEVEAAQVVESSVAIGPDTVRRRLSHVEGAATATVVS
jgi:hypothetical protein